MANQLEACLMTNFLSYRNMRGYEILEGTYTATNEISGKDCGGGKVYLEKEGLIKKIANPGLKNGANNANTKNAKTPIPSTSANKTTTAVVSKIPITIVKSKESSNNIISKPIANSVANNAGNTIPKTNSKIV